jgi:hypothetical protein
MAGPGAGLVPPLPEIAPGGIEQDAQPPGCAAAGEKIRPPFFSKRKTVSLISPAPPDLTNSRYFFHHVVIHVEKQFQRAGNVSSGNVAQVRRDGMRRFRDERAPLELAADFQNSRNVSANLCSSRFELMKLSTRCHADRFGPAA